MLQKGKDVVSASKTKKDEEPFGWVSLQESTSLSLGVHEGMHRVKPTILFDAYHFLLGSGSEKPYMGRIPLYPGQLGRQVGMTRAEG